MKHAAHTVYTLGPDGTDASVVAKTLSSRITYCSSFEEAMQHAVQGHGIALVACGYKSAPEMNESWGDLHFSYIRELMVLEVMHAPTKPMCIAINTHAEKQATIALHPTTERLLKKSTYRPVFFSSKVAAVEAAAIGTCDACIGSRDIILRYSDLTEVEEVLASMVWVVYGKKTV